jgi:hypothetical protein
MVLALAMVFSLVFSSVTMAAPKGNKISNELELTVTVEAEKGTIGVSDLATTSAKNLWDLFKVYTAPPEGYTGEQNVKGKVKVVQGNTSGFKLEYLEQDPSNLRAGEFIEMTFNNNEAYFGPAEGFPWQVVDDSIFRVTWLAADNYEFKLSLNPWHTKKTCLNFPQIRYSCDQFANI